MLHNLKHKNSKTMGREAVRWQILTIAFLSLLIGVFCFGGYAAAADYEVTFDDITVNENVLTAEFTVSLNQNVQAPDEILIPFITTAGNPATNGPDFTDPAILFISIAFGNSDFLIINFTVFCISSCHFVFSFYRF